MILQENAAPPLEPSKGRSRFATANTRWFNYPQPSTARASLTWATVTFLLPLFWGMASVARAMSFEASTVVPSPSQRSHSRLMAVEEMGSDPPSVSPTVFAPPFPTFNSQRLDQQIRIYANYLATSGPPDVLIVGSSRSLQGIDPEVLQSTLANRGLPTLRIYNFGINGATAQVVELVLRRILTPDQLPRLIIWADGSRALNSARVDLTYNGILASEGYKQLADGSRPIYSIVLPPVEPVREVCVELPPVALNDVAYSHYLDIQPYFNELHDSSRLPTGADLAHPGIAYPPPVLPPRRSIADSFCVLLPHLLQRTPTQQMFSPSVPPIATPPIAPDLSASGFQSVPTEFNPVTYYQRFPRVSGRYDTNYTPFRLEGVQTTAAIAIAQFARRQGIPLVFVSLPLTQEYLDPVRMAHEQQFRQFMQRLANQEGFLFRDLMQRWSTQNNYFADPSHLNRHGARVVAQYLATDPMIPWLRRPALPIRGRE